jgi:hypothetical protein
MFDHLAAHWAPIRKISTRTRRGTIGVAIMTLVLLISILGFHRGAPADSGPAGCTSLSSTHHVAAIDYPKIGAQFAGSRWPDLRTAGTAYVDLAVALLKPQYTDGYETVWFYQRLSAACAKHGRALNAST